MKNWQLCARCADFNLTSRKSVSSIMKDTLQRSICEISFAFAFGMS